MISMKPTDQTSLEPLSVCLRSVKLLRSNVKDVFKLLTNGNPNAYDSNLIDDDNQCNFVNDLQNLMNNVNQRVRELETSTTQAFSTIVSLTNLGNVTSLGLDPNQDKQQLYNSMIQSYRWCDRLTDAAAQANQVLSNNHPKRTVWTILQRGGNRGLMPKKQLTTGYNIPQSHVENSINMLNKTLGFKIEFDYSFGEPLLLKITIDRVLKCVIILRGWIIEWVNAKGLNEEFVDLDDRLDIWSESKYEVFRKITDHMNSAMLHFSSPNHNDQALRGFLFWLKSYNNLFNKECKKCGNKLKDYLPPTWRDYRTHESYHISCVN